MMTDLIDGIYQYHQRTKHHPHAYAKGPGTLDWDDQPNPFRRFSGCEHLPLPLPGVDLPGLFADLDKPKRIMPLSLNLANLSLLLELCFGLSAWKQYGPDRWALRCNPSSGNLHPTEAYLLNTDASLMLPGLYHYASHDHHLERRSRFVQSALPPAVYIGLSSIHWREAWKYGERAYRYCQHDVGHALAALSYAAGCLGWSVELCSEAADAEIAFWLGLDRKADFINEEYETPDLFCRLHCADKQRENLDRAGLSQLTETAVWHGEAVRLSSFHNYRWPIIEQVCEIAQKPATVAERIEFPAFDLPKINQQPLATTLIRQRRSAQHFNAKANPIPLADFQRILAAVIPSDKAPFAAWNWPPQVHLILFVHNVTDLQPGLYLMLRDPADLDELQAAFTADFIWEKIEMPFSLHRLALGNVKQAAKTLSCYQDIAGNSAFSLGMLARFSDNLKDEAWRYRRLFWECGLIGQILYLEAEAASVRGTGIGCFFDDTVHRILGLNDHGWQSLYHFTIGEPLEDARLQTLPAYAHLLPTSPDLLATQSI